MDYNIKDAVQYVGFRVASVGCALGSGTVFGLAVYLAREQEYMVAGFSAVAGLLGTMAADQSNSEANLIQDSLDFQKSTGQRTRELEKVCQTA